MAMLILLQKAINCPHYQNSLSYLITVGKSRFAQFLFRYSFLRLIAYLLVTQPMLQHRPNRTELRLMDSYIQILCRLEGCFGPLKFESRIRDVCS